MKDVGRPDRDPFAVLADKLVGTMRKVADKHAASAHIRFTVSAVDPLEIRSEDGTLTLNGDDDDVEVHRNVQERLTPPIVGTASDPQGGLITVNIEPSRTIRVGDVVNVRETMNGYEVVGWIG